MPVASSTLKSTTLTEGVIKRFVVDSMLGRLAKWLRILGFDTRYELLQDLDQIEAYRSQGCFLITRREKLRGQAQVFCLTADDPLEQLREVISRASINPQELHLLQRCVLCNDQLRQIGRDEALGKVPDYILQTHTAFHRCPQCQRIYWPGSHPKRMIQRIEQELGWEIAESEARSKG